MKYVMFDVDGTLIDRANQPREEIIRLLKDLSAYYLIGVWSGGGKDYAARWVERLDLSPYVHAVMAKDRRAPERTLFCVDDVPGADFGVATLITLGEF